MRRLPAFALASSALVLAGTAPAWAHEEISPASVPTGAPAFLTVSAANEKSVDLTTVTITAPSGQQFGHATKDPAGWTSTVNPGHTAITWRGGPLKPEKFEQWGFEIEDADQPATLTYKATLAYADGTSENVDVPLVVRAASGTGQPDGSGGNEDGGSDGGDGRANLALGVGIAALLSGVGALIVAGRRRPGPAAAAGPAGGRDW